MAQQVCEQRKKKMYKTVAIKVTSKCLNICSESKYRSIVNTEYMTYPDIVIRPSGAVEVFLSFGQFEIEAKAQWHVFTGRGFSHLSIPDRNIPRSGKNSWTLYTLPSAGFTWSRFPCVPLPLPWSQWGWANLWMHLVFRVGTISSTWPWMPCRPKMAAWGKGNRCFTVFQAIAIHNPCTSTGEKRRFRTSKS